MVDERRSGHGVRGGERDAVLGQAGHDPDRGSRRRQHGHRQRPDSRLGTGAARNLSVHTFGEASVNLQATGIFQAGECVSFGKAYLKSRSADAFTSEIKDFISPASINISNCSPQTLNNTAWVSGNNITAISDSGKIEVGDP